MEIDLHNLRYLSHLSSWFEQSEMGCVIWSYMGYWGIQITFFIVRIPFAVPKLRHFVISKQTITTQPGYICNEPGEVKGQDHTNNEQTQSVDDII